ncbi:hypothetical protein KY362_05040 [Candidatus Woesearchaeota archaeon]|nr:hypothetical protein [Candidatus Woesearchaeota archaeon]
MVEAGEADVNLNEAAVEFARYVSSKYPQREGDIPYYAFAGSLGVMLLANADSLQLLDITVPLQLAVMRTIDDLAETKERLAPFTRQIGDMDFVRTTFEEKRWAALEVLRNTDRDEYTRQFDTLLSKGGGGPSLDELPELAKQIIRPVKGQIMVVCDPVPVKGEPLFAAVDIGGDRYLISDPREMLAYKVVHMLESFSRKPEAMTDDFSTLYGALQTIFPKEEIVAHTYGLLVRYSRSRGGFEDPDPRKVHNYFEQMRSDPAYCSAVKECMEALVEIDTEGLF